VDVGAQPDVVGEVPAVMVGVVVYDDVIAVPEPVIAIAQVEGANAEVEASKPKAVGAASAEAPDVTTADAAGEAAVFPRVIEVEANIVASIFMSDPLAVVVDVRGFRMAFMIPKIGRRPGYIVVRNRGRAMFRNVSATDSVASATPVVAVLGPGRNGQDERYSKDCGE
jgi:hypothetical protein